uniref:odorant receptor 131-2-like n=1 Tax=Semicossyphus pulcher TaxID=241346 RepID=UPI0037E791B1
MAENKSSVGGEFTPRQVNYRFLFVQLLVLIFLSVNFLLIATFFKKECFNTTARYILFAVTLLSDSLLLIMSNVLLLLLNFQLAMQVWLCIIIHAVILLYFIVTPVTLTAMTLERYMAICMPLRHGELCSTRSTVRCILIIHCLSSVPCIVSISTVLAFASVRFYLKYSLCYASVVTMYRWQGHVRLAVYQFYFLSMCIIIVVSYVKIMKAAKAASGENKKSTWKGLRTVILHAFQLLLCLIQLWSPFVETEFIKSVSYSDIRYSNYILFSVAPRCLSPLIYGLRDEAFLHELKKSFFCRYKRNN